jgi:2-(1,2-epoxy-1,2-dihydrophenyl)acetyl-CoA isomerase
MQDMKVKTMSDGLISIDTGTDELLCAIRDRVAVITLNRPEARNSLSDHLTPALRRMISGAVTIRTSAHC